MIPTDCICGICCSVQSTTHTFFAHHMENVSYGEEEEMRGRSRHHRKPRSRGGSDQRWNISRLPVKCHEAWHLLFVNYHPNVIANIINEFYLDTDWELVAQRRQK